MVYRKKPVEVEAVQWTTKNFPDVIKLLGEITVVWSGDYLELHDEKTEYVEYIAPNSYIVIENHGELRIYDAETFQEQHESIS